MQERLISHFFHEGIEEALALLSAQSCVIIARHQIGPSSSLLALFIAAWGGLLGVRSLKRGGLPFTSSTRFVP